MKLALLLLAMAAVASARICAISDNEYRNCYRKDDNECDQCTEGGQVYFCLVNEGKNANTVTGCTTDYLSCERNDGNYNDFCSTQCGGSFNGVKCQAQIDGSAAAIFCDCGNYPIPSTRFRLSSEAAYTSLSGASPLSICTSLIGFITFLGALLFAF